jgi:ribosomal protein S18 acetylase RimI-like enzyme
MPDMTGDPMHDPAAETPDEGSPQGGVPTSGAGSGGPGTDTAGHRLSASLTIGSRVVVRYQLEPGSQARATDFVGELVARNDDFLIVDTKKERVKLIRSDVIAAKDVPPPASRPGPAHERVSADDLETLMAKGWAATDRAGLGDWVLRSAGGFTGRANSALVVGDPSLPVDKAIDYVERWYAERDAPPLFQVHGEPGFAVEDVPAGAALLGRGYAAGGGRPDWTRVLVMTGLSAAVPPLTTASVPVTADAQLSPEWLMAYGRSRSVVPGATEAVLTGSDGQLFLSVRDETSGQIVGIARMAIHPGWAGIFGLWVDPAHRRRGIASTIVSAIAMVGRENAMPAIYLQVSADNADGVAFWQGLGFGVHHEYTYLARPAA